MASGDRQDYPAMLPELQPSQAVNILNDRVTQIGTINNAIASWLQERRKLEEQYSIGLRRLAQRPLDGVDLGIFSTPVSTLMSSADTLADSHAYFASKIQSDVERPLRDYLSSSREMGHVVPMQGNLQALARDVDRAQQKADKLREKGDSSKIASASSDLEGSQAHWQAQAPYVFENLQTLDEARLGNLRDALTQFQTHEMDQVERNRVSAEQCLNVLLNVETGDEIKAFTTKAVQSRAMATPSRPQRNSVTSGSASNPYSSRDVPLQSQEDFARERTGSTDEKAKGRFKGGLKRFGTVVGRKRDSKLPSEMSAPSDSPSRPRPSPLGSFGGRFSRSRDDAPTMQTLQETRPSLPQPLGSEMFDSPSEARADPSTPPAVTRSIETQPRTNGTLLAEALAPAASSDLYEDSPQGEPAESGRSTTAIPQRNQSLAALEGRQDSEGYSVPDRGLDPISQAQQEDAAAIDDGSVPQYNVNIRDAPIQEDPSAFGADSTGAFGRLQAPPPSSKRTSTIRGRRQDRYSFVPGADQTIAESNSLPAAQATPTLSREVSEPSSTPFTTATVSALPITPTPAFSQSSSSPFAPGQLAASTFSPFSSTAERPSALPTTSPVVTSPDLQRTDTQSIRSATTTTSQRGGKHPELTEPGLNSSIVETVSARFEGGKQVSASLIGELALAYNPTDFASTLGSERIRIENFSSLERVAPNPAFMTQIPDRQGEYTINLSGIAKTQVAFKYQVRLDDNASQAPLLITTAFKIEPSQASVIVSYSLNPASTPPANVSTLQLSNVMLALTIEGAKTTTCQSRPVGSFAREKNMVYWQLNDLNLSPTTPAGKLLARFATEGEAVGGNVEARWEASSEAVGAVALGSQLRLSAAGTSDEGEGTDPFADEEHAATTASDAWRDVKGVKKLVGGAHFAR